MKLKNEQLRQKILLAATTLIIAEGIEGTSTVKVAKKIEMSQSNIYSYFKNRQQLLLAVFDYHQHLLIEALAPNLTSSLAPVEQINQLILGLLQFGQTHFDTMRIIAIFRAQPAIRPVLPKVSDDPFFNELFRLMQQYQQEKIVKPVAAEFLMEGVFSIVNNYLLAISLDELKSRELSVDDVALLAVDWLLV
ncbi:TetR/AcrR family transcriptional regulator [Levilactobacillus bambusae]|uniref:HTH tetR-type domain-containing protein n=1 Tax=Levilactobacillus bambusae TaxID=2024736 RepID=A0A2V1N2G7_9LACO|nr:TetR/AcrR family transcriptional regulator [Levilactobacillus bambusae]PWG00475.1 hypothetical protein DCM90_05995 [Levilactobacillus bambusae]